MTTSSLRLGLILPDDGGAGGDDTVDVTTQISNNFSALDGAVGLFECTAITRPVSGNYNGRLIIETDTGKIYRYSGATWKYVCHDPTAQYAPAYDTIAVPVAGVSIVGALTVYRAGSLLILYVNVISTNGIVANQPWVLGTSVVGWRPAFGVLAPCVVATAGNTGRIIWDAAGIITFVPYQTYVANTTIQTTLVGVTAGYS